MESSLPVSNETWYPPHDDFDLENIVPHSRIPVDANAILPIALERLQGSRPNGESDDLFG
jgi:hypothetical protein